MAHQIPNPNNDPTIAWLNETNAEVSKPTSKP